MLDLAKARAWNFHLGPPLGVGDRGQRLGSCALLSQPHYQGAGLEVQKPGLELCGAGMASGGFEQSGRSCRYAVAAPMGKAPCVGPEGHDRGRRTVLVRGSLPPKGVSLGTPHFVFLFLELLALAWWHEPQGGCFPSLLLFLFCF